MAHYTFHAYIFFNTNEQVTLDFTLRVVTGDFHVKDDAHTSGNGYDVILGRDAMENLGMNLRFGDKTIEWAGLQLSMTQTRSS